MTVSQIVDEICISEATVKRALRILKSASLIERIGSDKTGHWLVKPQKKFPAG